jgi:hypothetical protein
MSWKWAVYAVLNVIIEVSATTEANRSDNLFQTASRKFKPCSGDQWLPFAVDKIRTSQDLSVAIEHSWHNVVSKEAQIPLM